MLVPSQFRMAKVTYTVLDDEPPAIHTETGDKACAPAVRSQPRGKRVFESLTSTSSKQATTTVVAATNERTNKRNEGRKEGTLHKESLTEGRKERKHTRTMPWTNRKKMSVMQCNQSTNQSVSGQSVGWSSVSQSLSGCVSALGGLIVWS